ncbi:hypothetical protein BH11ACT8_BH11ACT8_04940 [soil metagenome]
MHRSLGPLRLRAAAALVVLVPGLALVLGDADAATPAGGTVTTTSSAAWGGGPYVLPNQSGNVADPTCTTPDACDDYQLTVDAPAGYEDTYDVVVPVSWPDPAADFDVYLLSPSGSVLASAASSADPEIVTANVPPGVYTVRVVPFLPLGDSYTATASLELKAGGGTGGGGPLPGDPSTETAPTFLDYAPPSDLAGANDAGEPSIGNSFVTGATLFEAGLSTFKVLFDDAVTPPTGTWSDVSPVVTNGCATGGTTSLDPILFTDHGTGRTFASQLSGVNSLTCYTDDDGASWSPSTGGGIPSGVDHQTIGGGVYSAGALGPLPTSTYPDAVYYCSQDIATAFCAASDDGGTTFGAGIPTYDLTQCVGLHGHIKVAFDGTAYLPNKDCNGQAAVAVTEDGGLSYEVRPVPGTTAGDSDPSVGTGRDGTVYMGFVGADGKPGIATSTDRGVTWENQQVVGKEFAIKNAVFPAMVAGDDDRAAFAYVGTPTAGAAGETGVFPGVWHLYVDYTYDGGKTWVTTDATPADPVQRGSICTAGTTCGADRNLLDFIDITIDDHGRVLVGFADGCIDTCVTDTTSTAHDSYSSIARQSTGKTLFSKYDPVVDPGPVDPVNTAPHAVARVAPTTVLVGQTFHLTARGSSDAETAADQLGYTWRGFHVRGSGPDITARYGKRGFHRIRLQVADPQGLVDDTSVLVQVQEAIGCQDKRVHLRGSWRTVTSEAALGRRYCDNLGAGASKPARQVTRAVLGFSGRSVGLDFARKKGGGRAAVYIDDVLVDTISFARGGKALSFRGARTTYDGLSSGRHRIRLEIKGRAYLDTFRT